MSARLRVRYWVMASDRPVLTDTKDIGGGGVGLAVDEALKTQTLLAVELTMPGAAAPISFIGKVVWCAPSSQPGRFDAGIQFMRIEPKDQQALVRYVELGGAAPS